uniref:ATP synthase F0 subunit 8 n=1 Tax=Diprion wenshanicus TaxID=2980992 RepID=UPI0023F4ACA9|nr:ATP synthase F0 subunit 8 [Diprion wenshanicus]WDY84657.1 ATP synthase F0 subunit 8 [Diprion wenshanicus]
MPQMYPMNWLFLFLFFILIFILMIIICYFLNINFMKKKINKIIKYLKNWKW